MAIDIEQIPYQRIDFTRYDACIAESVQPMMNAASWYLDLVTDSNWEVLVYRDYEAVMPIPLGRSRKSWFRQTVIQPPFCQQLGMFTNHPSAELTAAFMQRLLRLKPMSYQWNHSNLAFLENSNPAVKTRMNLVLPLDTEYEDIVKAYSAHHLRHIRKASRNGLSYRLTGNSEGIEQLIRLKASAAGYKLGRKLTSLLRKVMTHSIENDMGFVTLVSRGSETQAAAFFLKSFNRIIYQMACRSEDAGRAGAAHYLIHNVIHGFAGTGGVLDFEGSEIPGVARFFHGFGAIPQPYPAIVP